MIGRKVEQGHTSDSAQCTIPAFACRDRGSPWKPQRVYPVPVPRFEYGMLAIRPLLPVKYSYIKIIYDGEAV